jgi:hypothetical protein
VANTLWAYATMGREPGAGVMRVLEGRAEAVAGTFNAQEVANTLWAACVFPVLSAPGQDTRLVHTGAVLQRPVSLGRTSCFNAFDLLQVHQFFVWCSVEPSLGVEAIHDLQSLKVTFCSAFEGAQTAPSASQQQVSKTLRDMGLSVEDEVRCPKSGYSFDMLVHAHDSALETGGEGSSGRVWAVERAFALPCKRGADRCHLAEATASGAAGPRSRQRALLGVGQVQGGRREGAVSEVQAG